MKINRLIKKLKTAKRKYGDLEVVFDYDGNYDRLKVTHVAYTNHCGIRHITCPKEHIILLSEDFMDLEDFDYITEVI